MECFQGNYDSFRTIQLPNNQRGMNVYLFPDCSITFSRRNIGALLNSEISKVAKSVKIEYPISSSILLKVSGHLWDCFEKEGMGDKTRRYNHLSRSREIIFHYKKRKSYVVS
ncbi:MAG: hypothetical protein DRP25_04625 [Thermotoga sp.]|nr:MAG: hypothetical protein DRP25_04625 [Thermotoga sp.]